MMNYLQNMVMFRSKQLNTLRVQQWVLRSCKPNNTPPSGFGFHSPYLNGFLLGLPHYSLVIKLHKL